MVKSLKRNVTVAVFLDVTDLHNDTGAKFCVFAFFLLTYISILLVAKSCTCIFSYKSQDLFPTHPVHCYSYMRRVHRKREQESRREGEREGKGR